MSDLEQRIQQWRQGLSGTFRGRPEVIDELESHVREEVQRQLQAGRPLEEAWQTAVSRLGPAHQLAAEFAKAPPAPVSWWPARLVWFLLLATGGLGAWLLTIRFRQGMDSRLLAAHVFSIFMGYLVAFGIGALASWSVLCRAVGAWDGRRAAALRAAVWRLGVGGLALTAAGVVLGAVWASEHLGRFWGWDLKEVGGLSVLLWYGLLLLGLLRWPGGYMPVLLLGVAGNAVVSLSWFGPSLLSNRLHAYGFSPAQGWFLAGFLAVQMILLVVALVPERRGKAAIDS